MTKEPYLPWATGPGEILRHGLDLLKKDNDTNRRLAMISIDNAVELMLKTFLGLPKRLSGLTIARREYQEFSESFPRLLDALEQYAPDKLDGVDLGTIEWYHRLRNELYHQGNGLTVEREKVVIYSELANLLFKNLFGYELVRSREPHTELLGEFMASWVRLEGGLRSLAWRHSLVGEPRGGLIGTMRFLEGAGILQPQRRLELDEFRKMRNDVVHGVTDYRAVITREVVERMKRLADLFEEAAGDEDHK
jgi:hypothetical protein